MAVLEAIACDSAYWECRPSDSAAASRCLRASFREPCLENGGRLLKNLSRLPVQSGTSTPVSQRARLLAVIIRISAESRFDDE